jgi:hypothetical protein
MAKMTPIKRLVAVVGTYQDRATGKDKNRYVNCGTLFQYEDGNFVVKLESLPAGNVWNGFFSCYDLEEKGERKAATGGGGGQRDNFSTNLLDDEIPF